MIRKFTALAVLTAATILAQTAPPSPEGKRFGPGRSIEGRVQRLTTLLTLTASQQTQITTILTDAATASQPLRTNLQDAHKSLRDAIESRAGDSQIDTAASQLGTVQGQLTAIDAKAHVRLLNVLTPEQREKLAAMPGAGGIHGGPGFGGPGGPGAPHGGGRGPGADRRF